MLHTAAHNKMIQENKKKTVKDGNLAAVQFDYMKVFDSILHGWINEVLQLDIVSQLLVSYAKLLTKTYYAALLLKSDKEQN